MWIIFFFTLAGLFAYLYWLNDEIVELIVRPGEPGIQLPLALLVFGSVVAGALLAGITSAISRGRKALRRWSARKVERRRAIAEDFYRRGATKMMMNDFASAREQFAQALDVFPDHVPSRLAEVDVFLKLGDPLGARKRMETLVAREPKNLDYPFKLAQILAESGEVLAAAEELRRIISQDGKRADWWLLLGECYRQSDRYEEASEALEKALKVGADPTRTEPVLRECAYLHAKAQEKNGDIDACVRSLKASFTEKDDYPPAHLLWAQAIGRNGRDEEAAEHLERVFAKTSNPTYLPSLEDSWIRKHEPNRMIRIYRKAISDQPDAALLKVMYANFLLRVGLIDEARTELRDLTDKHSEIPQAGLLLGEAFYRRQDFEQAGAHFRKALGPENQNIFRYVCTHCHRPTPGGYADRCPSCNHISSLQISLP